MKKVLIVDDEVLVRMGFRSIIHWESCGYTIVGDAADGREAMEKIRILHPDLVFTDLRMEGMDGFQLMKACKEEYPEIKFVVLSSYNDFENAREAMRCEALDYVFKLDVKPEKLRKLLADIHGNLSDSGMSRHQMRSVKSDIMNKALAEPTTQEAGFAGEFAAAFPGFDLASPFRLITIALDNYGLSTEHLQIAKSTMNNIEEVLTEFMGHLAVCCPFREDKALLLWQEDAMENLQQLQAAYGTVSEYIRRYLSHSLTAVMSGGHRGLQEMGRAYGENEDTLSYRYLLENGRIHGYRSAQAVEELPAELQLAALEEALASKSRNQVMALCEKTFSWLEKKRGLSLQKLRAHLLDVFFAIKRSHGAFGQWTDASGFPLEHLIQHADKLSIVREAMMQALDACLPVAKDEPRREEILQIVRYARAHLAEDLSVAKAARLTQVSESYFAHIFKREMGSSFIDWLNRERVMEAARLLKESDLRVGEIAERVGIDNANYFSVLFKKITGRTPLEERQLARKAGL